MTKAKATAVSSSPTGKRTRKTNDLDAILDGIDLTTLPDGLRPGSKVGPRTAPRPDLLTCGNA